MHLRQRARLCAAALACAFAVSLWMPAMAGTTGQLRGRVVDAATKAPMSGVHVSVVSPSQSAVAVTDAAGGFSFISLPPDTYTVTLARDGYDIVVTSGVTVVSDQTVNIPLEMIKTVKTIGRIQARASTVIVRPGTTSDVYAINAAAQKAASAVGGPGGVDFGYSALATVPGVNILQGQQGWQQLISIRGGAPGDVAVELDGIPMSRSSDGGTASTLSSLGQQELQAYTGGTPASADANGLSGYLNQVIRTGTYPGFGTFTAGVGGPAFYHKLSFEFGGATPNRNFSYYFATSGVNQDYRYGDQRNNAGNIGAFFYPLNVTGNNGVFDGSNPSALFSQGATYALATTNDRENIANVHFGIAHHNGELTDDVQLLYVTSEIFSQFYSSTNDLGGLALVSSVFDQAPTYTDLDYYTGHMFAPPDPSKLTTYFFPSSYTHRPVAATLDVNQRDGNSNGVGVFKLQYQRSFSTHSYLRLFGYTNYSDWFINGPVSTYLPFGGQISDFEITEHAWGVKSVYANELSSKNLLTVTAGYQLQRNQTYSSSSAGIVTTNFIDSAGNCYSPSSGSFASCFSNGATPPQNTNDAISLYSWFGSLITGNLTPPITAPAGSPAILNGARWIMTDNGIQTEQQDNVIPIFTSASITDQWRPNDRLTINAGIRAEQFDYKLGATTDPTLWPARAFWFEAFNRENCYATGQPGPVSGTLDVTTGVWTCPAGTTAVNLRNVHPNVATYGAIEPRIGFTYTLSPERVVRGSFGRYVDAASSSDQEVNATQQNLASSLQGFLAAGYTTPYHDTRPGRADNLDLSLEQHVHGTDYSFEISPFYRTTSNQVESVPIGAQGDVLGVNTGEQHTYGIEMLVRKGDFDREGISWQLSYAYTHNRVKYGNFGTAGQNFIDTLNVYLQHYNSFTSACAGSTSPSCEVTSGQPSAVAVACFAGGIADPTCTMPNTVANPYFNLKPQALFDRNGQYSPYDILPSPLQGAVGYETPDVLTAIVNYRHAKLTLTPSLTYSSGAFYGSPLVWPGYDPTTCLAADPVTHAANTQTCSQGQTPLFIPDPYSGKFDGQGAFPEPSRFTVNMQIGYAISSKVSATIAFTSIVDRCIQRGFAWDNASTCVYGQLPSNHLAPVGNFFPIAQAPVQLRFPYSSWLNNEWVGYVGQKLPFAAFASVEFKL
jgi:hypothetical protein